MELVQIFDELQESHFSFTLKRQRTISFAPCLFRRIQEELKIVWVEFHVVSRYLAA
jgi:hypothetical protein